MKIVEVVTQHPAVAKEVEFTNLLQSGEDAQDEIIGFILDDRNASARRLHMLRHLDELLGNVQDSYSEEDLGDFMHDQGPEDWKTKLQNKLADLGDKYKGKWDDTIFNMTDEEEAIQFAKDLKLPPYHLNIVDETEDDDTPTGEYEICQRCGGEGCIECEEGLKDITGVHKALNLDDHLNDKA